MKKLHKFIIFTLVLTLALGLFTITGAAIDKPDELKNAEDLKIGFVASTMSMTWMQYTVKAVEKKAEELNIGKFEVYNSENKVAEQMSNIEDCIANNFDAIVTNPINTEALTPALEKAEEAGIPVVTFDRKAENAPYLFHVGSDDRVGGILAANYIAQKIGGEGKVIELVGALGASPTINRRKGFHEALEKWPEIEVVYQQSGEFLRDKGMSVMEDALINHSDFDAVFSHNDGMMMGALVAIESAMIDPNDVVTISYDGIPDSLRAIRDGRHDATIQFPVGLAPSALENLVQYLTEGKVPAQKEIMVMPWIITEENLSTGDFYSGLE